MAYTYVNKKTGDVICLNRRAKTKFWEEQASEEEVSVEDTFEEETSEDEASEEETFMEETSEDEASEEETFMEETIEEEPTQETKPKKTTKSRGK